jgi:hypothetical protein
MLNVGLGIYAGYIFSVPGNRCQDSLLISEEIYKTRVYITYVV